MRILLESVTCWTTPQRPYLHQGRNRQDLDTDRLLSLALVRLPEVVGEAANRVSRRARDANPEIRWPQIISLRNRIIHGYDEVDLDIVWQIIREDLPLLIDELQRIIETDESKNRG